MTKWLDRPKSVFFAYFFFFLKKRRPLSRSLDRQKLILVFLCLQVKHKDNKKMELYVI